MQTLKNLFLCFSLMASLAGCDVVMNTQVGSDVGFSRFYSSRESTRTEIVKRPDGLWDLKNQGKPLGQLKASSPSLGTISFEVVNTSDPRLWVGRVFELVTYVPNSSGYVCGQCALAGTSDRTFLPPDWTAER